VDGVTPGSGQRYPLDWITPLLQHPRLIIAGGLTPDNLEPVLSLLPYAVDVSSGVEAAPRLKDPLKLRQFLDQVEAFNGTSRNQ
jgi:phosphoribosylanthranilate isomerase